MLRTVKVICGINTVKREQPLLIEMEDLLRPEGIALSIEELSSKAQAEYAVYRESDCGVFFVPERCFYQNAYQARELAALCDIRKIRIVATVDRSHYGTAYMAALYAAGILDAVFEDEADAHRIAQLLICGRNRKECREYYGVRSIRDAADVLRIMEEDTAKRYVRYISSGADGGEMLLRYKEIERKLNYMENCCLAEKLPESVLEEIRDDAGLGRYGTVEENKGKRGRLQIIRR